MLSFLKNNLFQNLTCFVKLELSAGYSQRLINNLPFFQPFWGVFVSGKFLLITLSPSVGLLEFLGYRPNVSNQFLSDVFDLASFEIVSSNCHDYS